MSVHKPRLCFVALSAYPLLSGKRIEYIIGPDVQHVLIATHLKDQFDISFITYDEGGSKNEYVNGIEVIKVYGRKNRPNFIIKTLHLLNALRKANADLYFQHGGAGAIVPLFCKLLRKPCVIGIASDANVSRELNQWGFLSKLDSELEIRLADSIIAQSIFQKNMLAKKFKKNSLLIRNILPLSFKSQQKSHPPVVLWVGAIAEVKQPELFIELARAIPDAKFQMIAAKSDNENYYNDIKLMCENVGNLEFVGFVPFDEIDKYYASASILVNTSKFEGYPNAFVQSWMNHVPVVSLNADPDGVICKHSLGFHSQTFTHLVSNVNVLLRNEPLRHKLGNNCRRYAEREHNIDRNMALYKQLFQVLVNL